MEFLLYLSGGLVLLFLASTYFYDVRLNLLYVISLNIYMYSYLVGLGQNFGPHLYYIPTLVVQALAEQLVQAHLRNQITA